MAVILLWLKSLFGLAAARPEMVTSPKLLPLSLQSARCLSDAASLKCHSNDDQYHRLFCLSLEFLLAQIFKMTPLIGVLWSVSNFDFHHFPQTTVGYLSQIILLVVILLNSNQRRVLLCHHKTVLFPVGPALQHRKKLTSDKPQVFSVSPKTTQKFLRLINRTRFAQPACRLTTWPGYQNCLLANRTHCALAAKAVGMSWVSETLICGWK